MELPENSPFEIKLEYLQKAREMIVNPELPIARVWVRGDVEGKTSISLGWMNGQIEDILRVTSEQAIYAHTSSYLNANTREVTLILYPLEKAIMEIARELPGHELREFARVNQGHDAAPLLKTISPQEQKNIKVAFTCLKENKNRYVEALKSETKFEVINVPDESEKLAIVAEV